MFTAVFLGHFKAINVYYRAVNFLNEVCFRLFVQFFQHTSPTIEVRSAPPWLRPGNQSDGYGLVWRKLIYYYGVKVETNYGICRLDSQRNCLVTVFIAETSVFARFTPHYKFVMFSINRLCHQGDGAAFLVFVCDVPLA